MFFIKCQREENFPVPAKFNWLPGYANAYQLEHPELRSSCGPLAWVTPVVILPALDD